MSNELSRVANEKREDFKGRNVYNSNNQNNKYGSTHTNALADDLTPIKGKGVDGYLNTYAEAGGSLDINGAPEYPGSGRNNNINRNIYNKNTRYQTPDIGDNEGQYSVT